MQVQSGGQFDVDFDITDPRQIVLLSGNSERQGDYVVSAREPGEFSLCFSNAMSTFAEKVIDFDLTAEHETVAGGSKSKLTEAVGKTGEAKKLEKQAITDEYLVSLSDHTNKLFGSISVVSRNQRVLRTTENRNISTVKSMDSRLFWFAVIESCLMVGMSLLQVYVIQTFFSKSVRTRV
eukprot:jgi/Hompol1/3439/HPOL_006532-RA